MSAPFSLPISLCTVHQYDVLGVHGRYEISIQHEVDMHGEAHVINKTIEGLPLSLHCHDLPGLGHDLLRMLVLDCIPGDDAAILRIGPPPGK